MRITDDPTPSSSSTPPSELNEVIIATIRGPETPEFKELRKQHPRSKFIWHELPYREKSPKLSDKPNSQQEKDQLELKPNGREIVGTGLLELFKEATILFTTYLLPLPEQAPKLKWVQMYAAGFDEFLTNPLFTDTDIVFTTANGVHGPQITEHIFLTLLSTTHHFPLLHSLQRSHNWTSPTPPVHDLVNQRIGILGYGSIGRQVARVANSFGMSIHAYTASPRPTPSSRRDTGYVVPGTGDPEGIFPEKWYSGTTKEELHEFLGSGLDVLVIAAPLTSGTRHLLSGEEFGILSTPRPRTRRGAFVVNISRGGIIDHDALLVALKKGLEGEEGGLRGASLDVTEPEPLPRESELWDLENVVITPHISGNGSAYLERVIGILGLNLERLKTGGRLVNVVDRKREY